MVSPDRRLGLALGAVGLAGLGLVGGGIYSASEPQLRKLQDEQRAASTSTVSNGIENARKNQIVASLTESIVYTAGGAGIAIVSVGGLVGGAIFIYQNRRRPEPA